MPTCERCEESPGTIECQQCGLGSGGNKAMILCQECSALIHIGRAAKHKWVSVDIQEKRDELKSNVETWKGWARTADQRREEINLVRGSYQERLKLHERNIRRAITEAQAKLKQRAKTLMEQLQQDTSSKENTFTALEKMFAEQSTQINQICQEAQALLDKSDDEFVKEVVPFTAKAKQHEHPNRSERLPTTDLQFSLDYTPVFDAINNLNIIFPETKQDQSTKIEPWPELQDGSQMTCYVSTLLNKSATFWVVPEVDEEVYRKLTIISDTIRKEFVDNVSIKTYKELGTEPAEGAAVYAKFSLDQQWYRGVVEEAKNVRSGVGVRLIDYGNHERVGLHHLIPATDGLFHQIPQWAFEATLFDEATVIQSEVRWEFGDLTKDVALAGTVLKKVEFKDPERTVYKLKLVYFGNDGTEEDINKLIETKVAETQGHQSNLVSRDIRLTMDPSIQHVSHVIKRDPQADTSPADQVQQSGDIVTGPGSESTEQQDNVPSSKPIDTSSAEVTVPPLSQVNESSVPEAGTGPPSKSDLNPNAPVYVSSKAADITSVSKSKPVPSLSQGTEPPASKADNLYSSGSLVPNIPVTSVYSQPPNTTSMNSVYSDLKSQLLAETPSSKILNVQASVAPTEGQKGNTPVPLVAPKILKRGEPLPGGAGDVRSTASVSFVTPIYGRGTMYSSPVEEIGLNTTQALHRKRVFPPRRGGPTIEPVETSQCGSSTTADQPICSSKEPEKSPSVEKPDSTSGSQPLPQETPNTSTQQPEMSCTKSDSENVHTSTQASKDTRDGAKNSEVVETKLNDESLKSTEESKAQMEGKTGAAECNGDEKPDDDKEVVSKEDTDKPAESPSQESNAKLETKTESTKCLSEADSGIKAEVVLVDKPSDVTDTDKKDEVKSEKESSETPQVPKDSKNMHGEAENGEISTSKDLSKNVKEETDLTKTADLPVSEIVTSVSESNGRVRDSSKDLSVTTVVSSSLTPKPVPELKTAVQKVPDDKNCTGEKPESGCTTESKPQGCVINGKCPDQSTVQQELLSALTGCGQTEDSKDTATNDKTKLVSASQCDTNDKVDAAKGLDVKNTDDGKNEGQAIVQEIKPSSSKEQANAVADSRSVNSTLSAGKMDLKNGPCSGHESSTSQSVNSSSVSVNQPLNAHGSKSLLPTPDQPRGGQSPVMQGHHGNQNQGQHGTKSSVVPPGVDLPSVPMETGAKFLGHVVTNLHETGNFWFELLRTESQEQFFKAFQAQLWNLSKILPSAPDQLEIGSFVLAPLDKDHWGRAQVAGPASGPRQQIQLCFIDCGKLENIPKANIKTLPEKFTHFPAQTVHCSIATESYQWFCLDAQNTFNIMKNKTMEATVVLASPELIYVTLTFVGAPPQQPSVNQMIYEQYPQNTGSLPLAGPGYARLPPQSSQNVYNNRYSSSVTMVTASQQPVCYQYPGQPPISMSPPSPYQCATSSPSVPVQDASDDWEAISVHAGPQSGNVPVPMASHDAPAASDVQHTGEEWQSDQGWTAMPDTSVPPPMYQVAAPQDSHEQEHDPYKNSNDIPPKRDFSWPASVLGVPPGQGMNPDRRNICFSCNEPGHLRKDCPNKYAASRGRGGRNQGKPSWRGRGPHGSQERRAPWPST